MLTWYPVSARIGSATRRHAVSTEAGGQWSRTTAFIAYSALRLCVRRPNVKPTGASPAPWSCP
eukprot:12322572-Karenia_brevis.AAC.1